MTPPKSKPVRLLKVKCAYQMALDLIGAYDWSTVQMEVMLDASNILADVSKEYNKITHHAS